MKAVCRQGRDRLFEHLLLQREDHFLLCMIFLLLLSLCLEKKRKSLRQQHGFKDFDEYKRSIEQFDLEDGLVDTKSPAPRSQRNLKNSRNGGKR